MINLGETAPDFKLPGIENGERRDFTLSEYRGRNVVLAFYPGDNTPGCTKQLCSYRDDWSDLERLGAVLLGISPQDVDSHEKFATKHKLPVPVARRHRQGRDRGVRRRCADHRRTALGVRRRRWRHRPLRRPQAHRRHVRPGRQDRPGAGVDRLTPHPRIARAPYRRIGGGGTSILVRYPRPMGRVRSGRRRVLTRGILGACLVGAFAALLALGVGVPTEGEPTVTPAGGGVVTGVSSRSGGGHRGFPRADHRHPAAPAPVRAVDAARGRRDRQRFRGRDRHGAARVLRSAHADPASLRITSVASDRAAGSTATGRRAPLDGPASAAPAARDVRPVPRVRRDRTTGALHVSHRPEHETGSSACSRTVHRAR